MQKTRHVAIIIVELSASLDRLELRLLPPMLNGNLNHDEVKNLDHDIHVTCMPSIK